MNKFSPFTDERGNHKSQLGKSIIEYDDQNSFPAVSPEALLSIHKCGQDGFIEEKVLDYFYIFLQEIVLIDNIDKTNKVPHIYMEPTHYYSKLL